MSSRHVAITRRAAATIGDIKMRANGWWDNEERTIARYKLMPGWDWQDLCLLLDQTEAIARKQQSAVHCIIDMQDVEPAPIALQLCNSTLQDGRRFVTRAREVNFAIAVIGASLLIKTLYSRFEIAYTDGAARLHFVSSLEQARVLLSKYQGFGAGIAVTASA